MDVVPWWTLPFGPRMSSLVAEAPSWRLQMKDKGFTVSADGVGTGGTWVFLVSIVRRFHFESSITSNQIQIRAAWHSALEGFDILVPNVCWSKILTKTVDKSPMTLSAVSGITFCPWPDLQTVQNVMNFSGPFVLSATGWSCETCSSAYTWRGGQSCSTVL